MTNRTKPVAKMHTNGSRLASFQLWVDSHKLATIVIVLLLLAICSMTAVTVTSYLHKFSKSDYDQLTSMAEAVLKESGGKDIQVSRTCSYERPTEFSNLHLYCRVAMVTYLKYENDEMTSKLAQSLLQNAGHEAYPVSDPEMFYASPRNNVLTIFTRITTPDKGERCRFEIATQKFAMKLGIGLSDQADNNQVALSFYCATASRAEYFPVTYRQG